MSKPTPGPWRAQFHGGTTEVRSTNKADSPVAVVSWAGFDDSDRPLNEHRANAEFIVRACNAHDGLLAACKSCLEMFADGGEPTRVIRAVEAAIALAEGTAP